MSSAARPIGLGIDGGGTHTRAALVDATGRLLGTGTAGPSNYQAVGVEAARINIGEATLRAWQAAGETDTRADAAFLGIAGVASDDDRRTVLELAADLALADPARIDADHDLRTALAGGLEGEPGIVLIAGTGSACYGRARDGRSWRSGGWGHLLDDLGSGYWLGLQAMIAATRAADGRAAATSLTDAVVTALGLRAIDDILRRLHHDGMSRTEIAALAPLVLDAADAGDMMAYGIIHHGAEELAYMVQAVTYALDWGNESVEMIMTGGLTRSGLYASEITALIRKRSPYVQVLEPSLSPVLGAVLLALATLDIDTRSLARRLRAESPSTEQ